ncbi:MAG: class I SAM-dependent methyltransferase [Paracoccaceae bacterium]
MQTAEHFNTIAAQYDAEIPEHIRLHLITKKTGAMLGQLSALNPAAQTGLDCGCGTGHYIAEMSQRGYQMSGFEYSSGMLDQARQNNPELQERIKLGSVTEIPHPENAFDFSYAINVLHHLPSKAAQITAVEEMLRVTRPGGVVFLHDFDADNPLARFYMTYIFPLTSRIDDDETEIWVSPKTFAAHGFDHAIVKHVDRFTLLPNVTPKFGFGAATSFEAWAERMLRRKFGGHFMMALEKV